MARRLSPCQASIAANSKAAATRYIATGLKSRSTGSLTRETRFKEAAAWGLYFTSRAKVLRNLATLGAATAMQ